MGLNQVRAEESEKKKEWKFIGSNRAANALEKRKRLISVNHLET